MRKVDGSRHEYASDGGFGRIDGEIVITAEVARIPYGPDGNGSPIVAAFMRAGQYLADNDGAPGAVLRWDFSGRAYAATLEPADPMET